MEYLEAVKYLDFDVILHNVGILFYIKKITKADAGLERHVV